MNAGHSSSGRNARGIKDEAFVGKLQAPVLRRLIRWLILLWYFQKYDEFHVSGDIGHAKDAFIL